MARTFVSCFGSESDALPIATGMITNVTGPVTQGSTLTITGTTLMDVDKTNWDPYFKTNNTEAWRFGSASRGLDGYATSGPGSDGTYVSGLISGGHACQFHIAAAFGGGPGSCPTNNADSYNAWTVPNGSVQWWGCYVMYNRASAGWPDAQIKMMDTCCDVTPPNVRYYWQPAAAADGSTLPSAFSLITDVRTDYSIGSQLQLGRWYWTEGQFDGSTPKIQVWMDGQQLVNMTPGQHNANQSYLEFGIVNACSTQQACDITNTFGAVMSASSRVYPPSEIEIGTSPSFTTKLWQPPTLLSDTSIQVTCDLTGLGAGPYYLRVTNNKRVISNTWAL